MTFSEFARKTSEALGSNVAFGVALGAVALWALAGPFTGFSETWQLAINTSTTIMTFLMVFLLQHTQNVDTKALQTKLDELIHAMPQAHNEVAGIEQRKE